MAKQDSNPILQNKAINRLTISRNDWEKCIEFLKELENHFYATPSYEALLIAAIIFYARAFSCNEKDSDAKANSRVDQAVLNGLEVAERELHGQIVELRNKAVAHIEFANHPVGVEGSVIYSMPFSIWKYFKQSDIGCFERLTNHVLSNAHSLTSDTLRRLSNP